jgi:hypothetical protein
MQLESGAYSCHHPWKFKKNMMPLRSLLVALNLFVPAAIAMPIAITGTASAGESNWAVAISGEGFGYTLHSRQGPIHLADCYVGAEEACGVSASTSAGQALSYELPAGTVENVYGAATIGNFSTPYIRGWLDLVAPIDLPLPLPKDQQAFTMDAPMQLAGYFTAFGPAISFNNFPEMFRVTFSAEGTGRFNGRINTRGSYVQIGDAATVWNGTFTFAGTAEITPLTQVPEPGTGLLLIATVPLAAWWLRRRRGSLVNCLSRRP